MKKKKKPLDPDKDNLSTKMEHIIKKYGDGIGMKAREVAQEVMLMGVSGTDLMVWSQIIHKLMIKVKTNIITLDEVDPVLESIDPKMLKLSHMIFDKMLDITDAGEFELI